MNDPTNEGTPKQFSILQKNSAIQKWLYSTEPTESALSGYYLQTTQAGLVQRLKRNKCIHKSKPTLGPQSLSSSKTTIQISEFLLLWLFHLVFPKFHMALRLLVSQGVPSAWTALLPITRQLPLSSLISYRGIVNSPVQYQNLCVECFFNISALASQMWRLSKQLITPHQLKKKK